MNTEALAAGLLKYGEEWWGPNDTDHMVAELLEWAEATKSELKPENVAHEMWTMGAWLKHKGCLNNPKRGNDADYSNGCAPCEKYLCALGELILQGALLAEVLAQTVTEAAEGKWYYRSRLDVIGKILRGDDIEPEAAPPAPCLCDAGYFHTEAENRARRPFIINPDCSIHGSQSQASPAPDLPTTERQS